MKMIVQQPNGLYALVSIRGGSLIMKNATVEEIRNRCVAKATAQIDSDIVGYFHSRSESITDNNDPCFDAVINMLTENGGLSESKLDELREMGVQI
jgi:hypothetical protein